MGHNPYQDTERIEQSLNQINKNSEKAGLEVVAEGIAVAGTPGKVSTNYVQVLDENGNPAPQPETTLTVTDIPRPAHPSAQTTTNVGLPPVSGLKDGGTRKTYGSGAQKEDSSKTEGKGAFHLMPFMPLLRSAEIWRKGAVKYAARNWEKGIALSRFVDSGLRHLAQCGLEGKIDEDHLHQGLWNFMALSWTIDRINRGLLPATLNDLPGTGKVGQPGYRKDGPGIELKEEQKGLPEEEVFGRKLTPEERYIPFVVGDAVYREGLGLHNE